MKDPHSSGLYAVWLCAIASAALFVAISVYLAPLNPNILALQFAATPQAFGAIIHTWPPEHLARFRNHLPVDCLLLLCYGTLGYLVGTRTRVFAAFAPWARRGATWALGLAALFDAAENSLHWWLTEVPRFGVPLPYTLATTAASIKWLLVLAYALVFVYALAFHSAPAASHGNDAGANS